MIGYNFRLGEIESAIGNEQLKKLKKIIKIRQIYSNLLIKGLANLKGLRLPIIKKNCTHSFYTFPIIIDKSKTKFSRKVICRALRAEGIQISEGYINLHTLPIFKHMIAYGSSGFPWTLNKYRRHVYRKVSCPIAEELHNKTFMHISMYSLNYKIKDIKNIIKGFTKVWKNMGISN